MGMASTHELLVRPIKIRVIDSITKKPLQNILVYYTFQSYHSKDKIFFFIKNPDPSMIKTIKCKEKKYTDENGEVEFKRKILAVNKREKLYDEDIFINLDINLKSESVTIPYEMRDNIDIYELLDLNIQFYRNGMDMFNNPDPMYKGFYINSSPWEINPENRGGTERDIFNILWNGKGLIKEKEDIVVELERKQN